MPTLAILWASRARAVGVMLGILACACSGSGASSGTSAPPPSASPVVSGLGRRPDAPTVACARERASAPLDPDATPTECRSDADCAAGQNGRCLRLSNHGGHGPRLEATYCSYDGCFTDADCGARATCGCAERSATEVGLGHACLPAECTSDAECGAGGYCRRTTLGNRCHMLADECVEETDCGSGRACMRTGPAGVGVWRCAPITMPTG